MSNVDKALSTVLGIDPIEKQQEIIVPEKKVESVVESNDAASDYNLSRRTFKDLIEKGNSAIDHLFDLAKSSEHPRSYEVLATLIKTVSDTTKDLYDLQKKSKDLKKADMPAEAGNVTVERAVFVGSTADLLKKVKESKE